MAKKFAEHNGLNLTKTNNDVLAEWEKNDICLLYTSPSPRD